MQQLMMTKIEVVFLVWHSPHPQAPQSFQYNIDKHGIEPRKTARLWQHRQRNPPPQYLWSIDIFVPLPHYYDTCWLYFFPRLQKYCLTLYNNSRTCTCMFTHTKLMFASSSIDRPPKTHNTTTCSQHCTTIHVQCTSIWIDVSPADSCQHSFLQFASKFGHLCANCPEWVILGRSAFQID